MKKRMIFFCCVGLLIALGYSAGSCSGKAPVDSKTDSYLSLLPNTPDFLFKISSIETVVDHFSVTRETIFGRPIEDLTEIRRKWGFNPFVPDELREHGFDTTRELVLAMDHIRFREGDEDPVFTGLILVPVTNASKASKALRKFLKNSHSEIRFTEKESATYFDISDPRMQGGIAERNGYLLITTKPEGEMETDRAPFITGKADIQDKAGFQNVLAHVDSKEEIFIYADIHQIVADNLEAFRRISREAAGEKESDLLRRLDFLRDYLGAGLSVDLDRSDLLVNGRVGIAPNSDTLKVLSNVRYNKRTILGVPENPAILFSTAVNVPEYYRILQEAMTPEERQAWTARMAAIQENLGIDVEKEILSNIDGNLNVGIYDGLSINITNYNLLVTLSIKDEARMKSVLEQAFSRLAPEQRSMIGTTRIGQTEAYVLTLFGAFQFYIGVGDRNLILSVGKPMFEKAVFGKMESGFLSRMSDPDLIRTLKGDGGFFYLNIREVHQALKNFLFLVRQFNFQEWIHADSENALQQFEYLLISSQVKENGVLGAMEIETRFQQPFFKGLYEILRKIEAAAAEAEKAKHSPSGP